MGSAASPLRHIRRHCLGLHQAAPGLADPDAGGNTYQIRYLSDGSAHRVLKNFPSREELEIVAAEFAVATTYWELDHYWVFTYVVR